MDEVQILLRLFLSFVLAGIIGIERELSGKVAGLRTHMLVGLGSTVYAIVSIMVHSERGIVDPSRVAAQVVSGIGFIGAGAIFRDEDRVRGLTTASDIWVMGAIGLSVGLGYFLLAALSTFLVLIVLIGGAWIEKKALKTK
ncbi:MAG: MgtC/SapB family protein [Candidatus Hydrothermales bacterium]